MKFYIGTYLFLAFSIGHQHEYRQLVEEKQARLNFASELQAEI